MAAGVFLLGLPIAVLSQILLGAEVETMIHLLFGLGSILLSLSVFDFRTPRWITWIGCASAGAFGAIFLLQGLSELLQNDELKRVAFQLLGQRLERVLPDFVMFWFVAMLLTDSDGKTKILGYIVMSIVVAAEVYSYILSYRGDTAPGSLKLLFLLPFVWFFFESKRRPRWKLRRALDAPRG